MRSIIWCVLFVLLLSAFAFSQESEEKKAVLPKAEEILDRYVKVTGGREAYDKIKNSVAETEIELLGQDIKLAFTICAARPNKVYSHVSSQVTGTMESGSNGEVVWSMADFTGPVVKEGREKAQALRDSRFFALIYWRDIYARAECRELVKISGKDCYKVVITPKPMKPVIGEENKVHLQTYCFDKETGLLVMKEAVMESDAGDLDVKSIFSDYRKVEGILVPHVVESDFGIMKRKLTTKSLKYNVELPKDRFALPEEIKKMVEEQKAEAKEG
jgi:hypothetical protein